MLDLKLTKDDLAVIVQCIRLTNVIYTTDSTDLIKLKQLVPGAMSILLQQCFGEYNLELIVNYALESSKNKFENIDQLYDYLKDPYSYIVQDKYISTLNELEKQFPNEPMFKFFVQYISKCQKNS